MVEEGTFREDLYYRLEVVNIHIPPLRNRPEDIPALIDYFLRQYGKKHGKEDLKIRPSAYAFLLRYGYPGNVRQLRNVIERLVVLSDKSDIDESDLPEEIRFYEPGEDSTVSAASFAPLLGLGFRAARERFEKKYLLAKLAEHNNNITHTAEAIGVHRQSLQQKIKDLNLKRFLG